MPSLINIAITLVVSALSVVGIYNYVPQDALTISGEPMLGASITTIQGTDTLSNSRSTINTNFANLNADKLEITDLTASTTLTVGTITSGTWSGTAIAVAKGGTGTTTPTLNQVMLGNGSSGFKVIGFGTSGQFLTSGGDATAPSWTTSAIDTALDYTWTGTHSFATTTIQQSEGGLVPVGSVQAYASSTAPTGWLYADGSAVSRSTYWKLFEIIGTTYGVGDGSTTFNLPNLKGRNIIGYGSATTTIDTIGEKGGEENHTLSTSELPPHSHQMQGGTGATSDGTGKIQSYASDGTDFDSGSTGSGTAFNVLDPYIVLYYIIKY